MNYCSILEYREIATRKPEKKPIKKKYLEGVGLPSFRPIGKRGAALEIVGRVLCCSALVSGFFQGISTGPIGNHAEGKKGV